ncbi:relaxase MobL [Solobacterium moorei]|uniref:relaxase MobL n=1 Tax=Solobacterium moorei TaxID=102148 RepID=UPI0028E3BB72|nr:relaxase MobL [Solobacterium moorei]
MPVEIDKIRFFELGMKAPKNSRFKGIITQDTVFGRKGWLDYTGREEATQPDKGFYEDGNEFIGYTLREGAAEGLTMTSNGTYTAESIHEFKNICRESFKDKGDIVWDMVVALPTYDYAESCGLRTQHDYAGLISKVLPQFFKKVGLDSQNMLWWENYHKNTEHPHMHICFLEKNKTRSRGKVTLKQLKSLKAIIIKELSLREDFFRDTAIKPEQFFKNKDAEIKEMIRASKNYDFSKIKTVTDLALVLPRYGRMQYGSYQMMPYREKLDEIAEEFLNSDALKEMYKSFLEKLDTLSQTMDTAAGTDIATIKDTEIKKLHKQIGNIILDQIKDMRAANYKSSRLDKPFVERQFEKTEVPLLEKNSNNPEWKEYLEVKRQLEHINSEGEKVNHSFLHGCVETLEGLVNKITDSKLNALVSHRLAKMYFYGEGGITDPLKTVKYAKQGIKNGYTKDYILLAKAQFKLDRASEGMDTLYVGMTHGDPLSTYSYGIHEVKGDMCNKNKIDGFRCIKVAAEMGCLPAINYLKTHDKAGFKETVEKNLGVKIKKPVISSGKQMSEASKYMFNSSQLSVATGLINREIEAYLNNDKELETEW